MQFDLMTRVGGASAVHQAQALLRESSRGWLILYAASWVVVSRSRAVRRWAESVVLVREGGGGARWTGKSGAEKIPKKRGKIFAASTAVIQGRRKGVETVQVTDVFVLGGDRRTSL